MAWKQGDKGAKQTFSCIRIGGKPPRMLIDGIRGSEEVVRLVKRSVRDGDMIVDPDLAPSDVAAMKAKSEWVVVGKTSGEAFDGVGLGTVAMIRGLTGTDFSVDGVPVSVNKLENVIAYFAEADGGGFDLKMAPGWIFGVPTTLHDGAIHVPCANVSLGRTKVALSGCEWIDVGDVAIHAHKCFHSFADLDLREGRCVHWDAIGAAE